MTTVISPVTTWNLRKRELKVGFVVGVVVASELSESQEERIERPSVIIAYSLSNSGRISGREN